jgi:hypothetical protein
MSLETQAPGATSTQGALAAIAAARSLARLESLCTRGVGGLDRAASGRHADAGSGRGDRGAAARGAGAGYGRKPRRRDVAAAAQALGRPSCFPSKRKVSSSPDRGASLERRRLLASSGVMPPALAARFTTGELAALRIVADEVRDKSACRLTLGEIAARAGVGITTARRGLREAAAQGLVTIEERRRHRRPNLANVVRVLSAEWLTWIARGRKPKTAGPEQAASERFSTRAASRGGGCKKMESTDKGSGRTLYGDRALRGQKSFPWPSQPASGRLAQANISGRGSAARLSE